MRISPELFRQMLSALLNAQESLTYFCQIHEEDDAGELALQSVIQAIIEAQKVGAR